jgi:hypothetical protein
MGVFERSGTTAGGVTDRRKDEAFEGGEDAEETAFRERWRGARAKASDEGFFFRIFEVTFPALGEAARASRSSEARSAESEDDEDDEADEEK